VPRFGGVIETKQFERLSKPGRARTHTCPTGFFVLRAAAVAPTAAAATDDPIAVGRSHDGEVTMM
jgi:hypothetical protein